MVSGQELIVRVFGRIGALVGFDFEAFAVFSLVGEILPRFRWLPCHRCLRTGNW